MFINGAWEIRQGRNICRSMLVWQIIDEKNFVGVVAGYSGGGGFQLEQFAATVQDSSLVSLMIDTEDKITGKEINFFEDVPTEWLEICDDAQDIVLEWNNEDEWEDAEQLYLSEEKSEEVSREGDMLFKVTGSSDHAKAILELAGITSSP